MTRKYTTIALLMLLAATAATAAGADKPNFLEKMFGRKPKRTSGGAEKGNYSILLYVSRSPGSHIAQAKRYKANTEKYASWKYLFIVHKEDHSLLFWGKYATLKDAQPNLKKAKQYLTPAKVKVFTKAIVVPMPGKEFVGPSEWNLDNTDPKYVYTVLVAEFHDVPDAINERGKSVPYVGREKFAVELCKQLRKQGMASFYKHSTVDSIVTIGLFGKNAIQDARRKGKVVRKVNDPAINMIFNRMPKLAVNGREKLITTIDAKTKRSRKIPAPSYLMKIPRDNTQNADTTKPRPGNTLGHPKPGKTPGNDAGSPTSANKPGRTRYPRNN